MSLAPITLFVYNRPHHTRQTLEALAANAEAHDSVLYIFADGAKADASKEALQSIKETRELIKSKAWCKEVHIIARPTNFGLANSIIDGVTKVMNKHGKAIILEDDLVTSPYFLKFMNQALDKYEDEEKVACISAYVYPINHLPEQFFIKGTDCWGWAAWKRSWDIFEADGKKLLNSLKEQDLTHQFDFDGTYPYTDMLRKQIEGKNNSWAVRWHASAFLKNKLCLYPSQSLVKNIGADGSGTHFGTTTHDFDTDIYNLPIVLKPIAIEESQAARAQFKNYFIDLNKKNNQTTSLLKRILKKVLPLWLIKALRKSNP